MHCRVCYLLNFDLKIRSGQVWVPCSTNTKGQTISEWIYEVIISPKIWTISALCSEGRNLEFFCSYFGRNNGFTISFWNLLTFSVSNVMIIEYDNSSHVAIDKWDAFKSLKCFVYGWQLFWNFLNHYAIFLYFWMKVSVIIG